MSTSASPGPSRVFASIGSLLVDLFEPPGPASPSSPPPHPAAHYPTPRPSLDALPAQHTGSATARASASASAGVTPVLGGGGYYAAVGARVWLSADEACVLVDVGPCKGGAGRGEGANEDEGTGRERASGGQRDSDSDGDGERQVAQRLTLPPGAHGCSAAQLARLEADMLALGAGLWAFNERAGAALPCARIRYDGDVRMFEYITTPPLRPLALLLDTRLAGSAYLHVAPPYGPAELLGLVGELRAHADAHDGDVPQDGCAGPWRPKLVFEPWPKTCTPAHRATFEATLEHVDVISPNHDELFALYAVAAPADPAARRAAIERLVGRLLGLGVGPSGGGTAVVRAGRDGSCVATRARGVQWVPAYFADAQERVRDVTGAGNAYLGGYIAGLHLSAGDPYEAALYGTVSASFMVEQPGVPTLTAVPPTRSRTPLDTPPDEDRGGGAPVRPRGEWEEKWNGDDPKARLAALRTMCARARVPEA
ncbi:hypothetical protein Q5752_004846 [Cryptotrichosporon argae]